MRVTSPVSVAASVATPQIGPNLRPMTRNSSNEDARFEARSPR